MSTRRRSRVGCGLAVGLLGVALAAGACGGGADRGATAEDAVAAAPTSAPAPAVTTTVAIDHRYVVGTRTETYVDPSRPTSAAPGDEGAPDRTFTVDVWYPATSDAPDTPPDRRGAPYPMVLFSHGYAVTPAFYDALLTRWAAAGYVVVAPTYPLLSGVPAGPSHADYQEVFADHRFVLDRALADLGPDSAAHPLRGMVDPARVAAAGQSDGEVAAFGSAFLACCRDPRVRAVVAMAGILGNLNNPIVDPGVPVLHLVGEHDELQQYADAIAWDREHLPAPRWIVTLVDGHHVAPYRDPSDARFDAVVAMTTAFLDGTLTDRADRLTAIDDVAREQPDLVRVER